jgi:DNA-binding transcriptional MerR regulator
VRIGELAREAGVSTDTVRFYERSGLLPRAKRRTNAYRDYGADDVEHLRLLVELRRLDIPLEDAAQVAAWCHSGHCVDMRDALPRLIAVRRQQVAERIAGLQLLDARLARLEHHLGRQRLTIVGDGAACCDSASALLEGDPGGCACCAPAGEGGPPGP